MNNHNLEKIDLEGNLFGYESALEFGKLIAKNKVLRSIDLENNDLTNEGKNIEGIKAISEVFFLKNIKYLNILKKKKTFNFNIYL